MSAGAADRGSRDFKAGGVNASRESPVERWIASASPNKKQKAIILIVLDKLTTKVWRVGVENVAQFSTSFIHGGRPKAGAELTRNKRLSH
jgi:hypothetical protein